MENNILEEYLIKYTLTGNIDQVKRLLDLGANIEATDKFRNTPLIIASGSGYLDIVKLLLKNKANIETRNSTGNTPLYVAATNGYLNILKELFYNGANINNINHFGFTVLRGACKDNRFGNNLNVVSFLFEVGSECDASCEEFIATRYGLDSLIEMKNLRDDMERRIMSKPAKKQKIDFGYRKRIKSRRKYKKSIRTLRKKQKSKSKKFRKKSKSIRQKFKIDK